MQKKHLLFKKGVQLQVAILLAIFAMLAISSCDKNGPPKKLSFNGNGSNF